MLGYEAFMELSQGARTVSRGEALIYDYERGLLYRNGLFQRVLDPGRYRIWPFSGQRIVILDVRRASLSIANQKLLTADQITVTLNLLVSYHVAEPATASHSVQDYKGQLYADTQLVTRSVVGAATVDALLADRGALGDEILAIVKVRADAYGLDVASVGIKDVILAPRVRDLLMKEVEARRLAQATLVAAREEVAAMRALANAARLAEQHPGLLRLRELDTVRAIAQAGGNTVVLGVGSSPSIGVSPGRDSAGAKQQEVGVDEAEE